MAGVVETEGVPLAIHLLKDAQTAGFLLYAPNAVQDEAQQCADNNLIEDLVTHQCHSLARVSCTQFFQKGVYALLDVDQAFTAGKEHLTGRIAPQAKKLRVTFSCLRMRQTLEATIVDI